MMLAWSFAARTVEEVARLIRTLGKHRYVQEVDHRIHWAVDAALASHPTFAPHAAAFAALRRSDPSSTPPRATRALHRAAPADEVIAALSIFWTPDEAGEAARERLLGVLTTAGLSIGDHDPWKASPTSPLTRS